MDRFKALGTGARAALLAGGAVIVASTGYGVWSVSQPAMSVPVVANDIPAPEAPSNPAAEQLAAKAPDPAATATDSALPPTAEATPVEPEVQEVLPAAPTFDLVRVEPDGQALVAGQAEPGAKVILRLDGSEISGTTADPQGNFAVLFVLDPSPIPRMLTLGSILPGGGEIAALGEVALAPTVAAPDASAAKVAAAPPKPAAAPSAAASDVAAGLSAEPAPPTAPATAPPTAAATALLVTKDGVNVLQSSDQPVPEGEISPLSLDTISYTPAGDVQLAGRAPAGSVLRIYLDNAPLIDVAVGQDGRWASTMPMIDPGLYTLRVDALAADGKVSDRFETPFKRESPAALAAATQVEAPAVVTDAPPAEPPANDAQVATLSEAAKAAPTANKTAAVAEPVPPADPTDAPQNAVAANPAPKNPVSITVQPGFTLWGIATDQFGDGVLYVQVFEANKDKIRDPDLIYPGQVFVIPAGSE